MESSIVSSISMTALILEPEGPLIRPAASIREQGAWGTLDRFSKVPIQSRPISLASYICTGPESIYIVHLTCAISAFS